MDFKVVQGAGETRIAAAARMHPVIVGLSEGLQGSSLNAGNFNSARRLVADATLRPLWRNTAASLANDRRPERDPQAARLGRRLWYDDRDIAFLQEDMGDRADIQNRRRGRQDGDRRRASILTRSSSWLDTDDISQLQHSGLVSVQLQPPGTAMESTASAASNGSGKPPAKMPMKLPAP